MAVSYTSRLKLGKFEDTDQDWGGEYRRLVDTTEIVLNQMLRRNYVISGLTVTFTTGTLNFAYTSGQVAVDGALYGITGNNGSVTDNSTSWLYIQGGAVILSGSVPVGSYVALGCIVASNGAIEFIADLRPSYPRVNGVTIAPLNVAPTGNINIATSKRIVQADTVGSNYFLFEPGSVVTVVSKESQTSATAWVAVNLVGNLPGDAKFAVVTVHSQCFQCPIGSAYASMHVRGNESTDEDQFHTVAFGRGIDEGFYNSGRGSSHKFIIPVSGANKTIWYKTTSGGLGSGSFNAYVDLVGYMI